jgi:adenine-specific DNA-methyltransferase|tara:strand:+ start:13140 stop:13907 length:768 start_codon:yes stop_codon:yes gene_type:complete
MNKNTIDTIDCIEFLKSLPDDSVDLVLTDPPYFIGFDGGKGWDSQWGSEIEYLEWCDKWTEECIRVLKPNRMLIVWGTLKTETFLLYKLRTTDHNPVLTPQNEIIWSYNWGGRSKKNFARKHEYAWCWSKGKDFLFNDKDIRVERKVKKNLRTGKEHTEGTIPTCIWEKNNHTTSKDFVGWHPTTKNLDILERIIRAYTNPDDLVLDCFMGSASTAVAAMNCGRSYIGTEIDSEYHGKALERIAQANPLSALYTV